MSRHTGLTSSKPETHSDELQLAIPTKKNKLLMHEILPLKVAQYQQQDELNLLLNTTIHLIYHYFAVEQQPLLSLPEKASQVSRIAFIYYLIEIY